MKKMNKLTVAALALTAMAFASTAASAQVSAGANDLILSFEVGSGTGSSSNLEVDLGSYSSFTTTSSFTLPQLAVADLTSTYGSGWASDVEWSVDGSLPSSVGANAFDATTTTASPKTASSLTTPSGYILQLAGTLNGSAATSNSSSASVIGNTSTPASGISGSYTNAYTENNTGGTAFGFPVLAEQVGAGSDELYQFTQQNEVGNGRNATEPLATELGTFTLSNSGVFTYNGVAAAVPEPSAYALGICAAVLFFVLRRRASVQ